jgi:WD40 repeat protein
MDRFVPRTLTYAKVVLWDISVMEKLFKSDKEKATTTTQDSVGRVNVDIPTIKFICVSPVEVSHKFPVTDITWLEKCVESPTLHELDLSETYNQFISTSTDGTILVWDSRFKMRDVKNQAVSDDAFLGKPFMRIPISAADSSFDYSLTKLCFAPNEPEVVEKDKAGDKDKGEKGAQVLKTKKGFGKFYGGSEEGDILYIDFSIEKLNDEKGLVPLCPF